MFNNIDDAAMRLNRSIIRTKRGALFNVRNVEDERMEDGSYDFLLRGYMLQSGTAKTKWLSDVNLSPLPLGYVNVGRQAHFCSRVPTRMWKIGLTRENCHTYNSRWDTRWDEIYESLPNTVKGLYPSVEEVFSSLDPTNSSLQEIAFSREFSLCNQGTLRFKGNQVGHTNFIDKTLHLADDHQYLQEFLNERIAND